MWTVTQAHNLVWYLSRLMMINLLQKESFLNKKCPLLPSTDDFQKLLCAVFRPFCIKISVCCYETLQNLFRLKRKKNRLTVRVAKEFLCISLPQIKSGLWLSVKCSWILTHQFLAIFFRYFLCFCIGLYFRDNRLVPHPNCLCQMQRPILIQMWNFTQRNIRKIFVQPIPLVTPQLLWCRCKYTHIM
jgi:hypothetical protein